MSEQAQPYSASCLLTYPAYHHSGSRLQQSIRYIVLHCTEGSTAEGAAEYFTQPGSGGSANLVVDDLTCFRTLNDFVIPWGAPPLNTHGIHIEQAGFAEWTRAEWMRHEKTITRAAYKAARRCRAYKIPPRLLTPEMLERDFGPITAGFTQPDRPGPLEGGIVTHRIIDEVYHESTHTDPGENYPLDFFLAQLAGFLKGEV